jgi:VWFA-related protein
MKMFHHRRIAAVCAATITPCLCALAFLPAARAQQQPPVAGPTLKVTTEVVNVYAVVRNKHGQLIPNLTKDDFEIFEDGQPQKITYFSKETDTPLTLSIMVDTSPSQERVLSVEQREADEFIRQVIGPKDLAAVLHFDLAVELLQDFTNQHSLLTRAIDETVINGGGSGGGPLPGPFPTSRTPCCTKLYDAIYLASRKLLANQVGRKVIILLTDGEDAGSQETLAAALEAAQKADVMIYSVAIIDRAFYGFGGMGFNGLSVLEKLSSETGGRVIRVSKVRDTHAAFQEIANELRTQYLLGYTPSDTRPDGGFRKITVRVRERGDKVQARRGYYPPSSN